MLEVPATRQGWRSWWRVLPKEGSEGFLLLHYEFDASYIAEDRWVGPRDGMEVLASEMATDVEAVVSRLASIGPVDEVEYVWNTDFPA